MNLFAALVRGEHWHNFTCTSVLYFAHLQLVNTRGILNATTHDSACGLVQYG